MTYSQVLVEVLERLFFSLFPKEWISQEGERIDSRPEWEYREARQTYRILEENAQSIRVEAYEVSIYVDQKSGEIRTEVEDYLWGDWFVKQQIDDWPDPLAEAYLETVLGSGSFTDDFWVNR